MHANGKVKRPEYKGKYYLKKVHESVIVHRTHVSENYNKGFLGRLWGYFSFMFSSFWFGWAYCLPRYGHGQWWQIALAKTKEPIQFHPSFWLGLCPWHYQEANLRRVRSIWLCSNHLWKWRSSESTSMGFLAFLYSGGFVSQYFVPLQYRHHHIIRGARNEKGFLRGFQWCIVAAAMLEPTPFFQNSIVASGSFEIWDRLERKLEGRRAGAPIKSARTASAPKALTLFAVPWDGSFNVLFACICCLRIVKWTIPVICRFKL